jgi:chemotaxis protein methyltransferase CheR
MSPVVSPEVSKPDDEARALRLLLQAIFERYAVDFRSYAYSSLKRRVMRRVQEEEVGTITGLQNLVLSDPRAMERLQVALTIHVTAMFRDPEFYNVFRSVVVPALRTYPFLRFWVAGCSTGEEVYSLAILLHEEGLYSRSRIYATDISDKVLSSAKAGIFPLASMREYTMNYQRAGGHNSFAEYYTSDNEHAILRPFLRENVIFSAHNLAGDASFNEFHVIFCRNVMIYFDRMLQERVHRLFHESLVNFGYLGLGRSETLRFSAFESHYEVIAQKERVYRKLT